MRSLLTVASIALGIAPAVAQIVGDLPDCWKDCIDEQGIDCDVLDIPCICGASQGSFLPDTVLCARENCIEGLDIGLILTPLQLACDLAGESIPDEAIESAQSAANSDEEPTTVEVTREVTVTPTSEATTRAGMSLASTLSTLVTRTTTDDEGNAVTWVQPIVIGPGVFSYGTPSTITEPVSTTAEPTATEAETESATESAAETTNGGSGEQHRAVARDAVSFGFFGLAILRLFA